jgi:hypothetical protein
MRTKALLVAAAFAAGLATSMAQNVYSLNVVGYYNITVPANGFALIANQLNTTNNTLAGLLPSVPDRTAVYKWTGTTFAISTFEEDPDRPGAGEWSQNFTLNPGEGAFIKNPSLTSPLTITFVGEVLQGSLTNPIPVGFSIRSSMVPQAGGVRSVLGLPVADGDTVYRWTGSTYAISTWEEPEPGQGDWSAGEPTAQVGEAFFVKKDAPTQWIRSFTVQ